MIGKLLAIRSPLGCRLPSFSPFQKLRSAMNSTLARSENFGPGSAGPGPETQFGYPARKGIAAEAATNASSYDVPSLMQRF